MEVSGTAYSSCSAKRVKEKEREGGRETKGEEEKEKNKEKSIMGKVGEMAEIIAILEYQE